MYTELLSLILMRAEELQKENKRNYLNIPFIYLAMLDVGECSDPDKIVGVDLEEWDNLEKMIEKDHLDDKNRLIQWSNRTSDELDRTWSREFRIWLSISKRSAVDVYKYVKRSKNMKDYFEDSFEETEVIVSESEKKKKSDSFKTTDKSGLIKQIVDQTVALRETLLNKIIGQNNAVTKFVDGYFDGELTALIDLDRKGPKSIFLFAGSPGVGKTYLAMEAAKTLGLPTKRFDMSGYADDNSAFDLTGASANFKSPQPGALTGFVYDFPKSVLIFDEIEKAHYKVINLFLQVLDAGFLYDSKYEKNISFSDTIIIFTTNAGKQLYNNEIKRNFSDISKKVILDALEKDINPVTQKPFFPQAICSRLASGNVVMFNHLSANDLSVIAARKLLEQQDHFVKTFSVESYNCEALATTLLFSLGGHCDVRNLTGAVKKFFASEIFELFRLNGNDVKLKEIRWKIDLNDADNKVKELYELPDDSTFLFFGDEKMRCQTELWSGKGRFLFASSLDQAKKIIVDNELSFIAIDYLYGAADTKTYLNAEDIDSDGKVLFEKLREEYPDIPLFIWKTDFYEYNREEVVSFLNKGAYDVIDISFDLSVEDEDKINNLLIQLQQQKALDVLKIKHQVVHYETSQALNEDQTIGEIRVFNLRITTAVEAEEQNAVISADEKPDLHWEDVVVSEDAKAELQYFQGYLNNAKEFLKKGAKPPKGILLYGPPGTGKTSLAKVMASESDVTFLTASADQFISRWAGEGAQSIHHIFSVARKYAPAILFIDEIDSIGRKRSGDSHDGTQEILNALLTEMDGFKNTSGKPVLVMAATNLGGNNGNTNALDPALVRRFDRSICIDLPDKAGREKLINIFCNKSKIVQVSDEIIHSLAERSVGMSPALIEGAINASIREAIRNNSIVTDEILNDAFEKYHYGEEKKWNSSELLRTARHEAGHAFICNYYGEKPSYLTIVARDNHGGYMMQDVSEDKGIYTKTELLHKIATALGGRASELVYYGEEEGLTTGASGDLEIATSIAMEMICNYGMYQNISVSKILSNQLTGELSMTVDKEVNRILLEELNKVKQIICENTTVIDSLVNALMDKTHLNKNEIQRIISPEE